MQDARCKMQYAIRYAISISTFGDPTGDPPEIHDPPGNHEKLKSNNKAKIDTHIFVAPFCFVFTIISRAKSSWMYMNINYCICNIIYYCPAIRRKFGDFAFFRHIVDKSFLGYDVSIFIYGVLFNYPEGGIDTSCKF